MYSLFSGRDKNLKIVSGLGHSYGLGLGLDLFLNLSLDVCDGPLVTNLWGLWGQG